MAANHFGADQANSQPMEQREAFPVESEASLFPGGAGSPNVSFGEQMNLLDDSTLSPDNGSRTFMMASERVHGFGGIYYNLFNDSLSYPTEDINNSFLFPTGRHK